ncbi:hypothetical protein PVAP13_4NG071800 [Panicum virgatum]|uniref:Uncharacterized protein n=1 Tax=Panicum virgatum TaxID=38727 RepID=A0A8T0T124_PANVG|nr:hypothetical protein PVAP13_4NG071800 [Panicum virgatum]KAG2605432.1 hypothetical protein PVAP13_4NG071800 [Panicum virgatum]
MRSPADNWHQSRTSREDGLPLGAAWRSPPGAPCLAVASATQRAPRGRRPPQRHEELGRRLKQPITFKHPCVPDHRHHIPAQSFDWKQATELIASQLQEETRAAASMTSPSTRPAPTPWPRTVSFPAFKQVETVNKQSVAAANNNNKTSSGQARGRLQLAQVRPEAGGGEREPAQLLHVHLPQLLHEEEGGAVPGRRPHHADRVQGRAQPPEAALNAPQLLRRRRGGGGPAGRQRPLPSSRLRAGALRHAARELVGDGEDENGSQRSDGGEPDAKRCNCLAYSHPQPDAHSRIVYYNCRWLSSAGH